jgi:hypothetical protein
MKILQDFSIKRYLKIIWRHTLEKTCNTQMCRDTLFEKHWLRECSEEIKKKRIRENKGKTEKEKCKENYKRK